MAASDIDDMKQLTMQLHLDTSPFSTTSVCPSLTSSMLDSPDPMTPFSSDMMDAVMTSAPSLGCTPAELSMAGVFPYDDTMPDESCIHWPAQDSKQQSLGQSTASATSQLYPTIQSFRDYLSPDQGLVAGAALQSSFSRPIFRHHQQSDSLTTEHMSRWQPSLSETPPRTVAPSATFRPILPSSPHHRVTPSTPVQNRHEYIDSTVSGVANDPYCSPPTYSPCKQPAFVKNEVASPEIQPTLVRTPQKPKGRKSSRQCRKSAEKKDGGRCRRSAESSVSRSGLQCPSYIEGNSHPCSLEDCVDKYGKRKKFKRKEHLKRHYRCCHTGYKPYECWVEGCTTEPFNRTDNLKSHLLNTHGKKSPASRNKYIATLDEKSGVFDPSYRGSFNDAGWPIPDQKS